jgi:hypothetical protein
VMLLVIMGWMIALIGHFTSLSTLYGPMKLNPTGIRRLRKMRQTNDCIWSRYRPVVLHKFRVTIRRARISLQYTSPQITDIWV